MGIELAMDALQYKDSSRKVTALECDRNMASLEQILNEYLQLDAVVILWRMQDIVWGRWQDKKLVLADPDQSIDISLLLEIRVFNQQEEIHLVRYGEKLSGRYSMDGTGDPVCYVDSAARFWGSNESKKVQEGYAEVVDSNRKLHMRIPCDTAAEYYALVTRNYIAVESATGQAGYNDYRFLAIIPADGGKE